MPNKIDITGGHALDDLIATKIVGLRKARGIFIYWKAKGVWEFYNPDAHEHYLQGSVDDLHFVYEHEPGIVDTLPPAYSTDISSAFKLADFMRKDGFSLKLWTPSRSESGPPQTEPPVEAVVSFICSRGPCEKHGNMQYSHHGAYDVEAETVPLAICKAAVIARKVA